MNMKEILRELLLEDISDEYEDEPSTITNIR